MNKPVILTGLRANSEFHIGNYLGALLPMVNTAVAQAKTYDVNMMLADLHSLTTPIDHDLLQKQIMQNLRVYIAAGLPIDHTNIHVYRQSYIPAHSELAWILDCFTYFGEANRMVEFKDKSGRLGNDAVTIGLFNYPPLMAADILLYGAEWIPLGDDQQQHLELTRDIAMRMNNKFGDLFVVPHEWKKQLEFTSRGSVRIRSLRNPDKKMSKSIDDPAGTILLSDKPEEAAKKVMSATTDSLGSIHLDWAKQPGISNLLQVSALLQDVTLSEVLKKWESKDSYGDLKTEVANQVKQFLADFQSKLARVDDAALVKKLEQDEETMCKVANATLLKVQKAVGLRPA